MLFPESAHGIVCFNTTDKGLIFIEPQNDDLMKLTEGKPYWPRSKYQAPPYDDTVLWFAIIW